MASALPTPNSCCSCGSSVNTQNLDSYIKESVDANIAGGNTFADAAALRGNTTYVSGVQYYVSTATGGDAAGEWIYNSTDLQTDDGSTVVRPNAIGASDPGRYTRKQNLLFGG